ncbi:hypothetical protein BG846_05567 [Streptomyces fradiae ATCC 10745 = DSM 40063]|uniref:Uncharacterized protein n=1 Tax=Streptomyces fradiae ATCC 10745 = DSM 40063 TaxID=1319510 RepID=A0A1Y2NP67_STRFR|nr:hypothetical protein BG846_05567 [Streptomyces fradiae ATCC 10745 = DSM 40063]
MPDAVLAAVSRIERMRSSGRKGLPRTMPRAASWPARSGSSESGGSVWTMPSISSKKEKSLAWTVLKSASAQLTKRCSGGSAAAESG